MEPRAFHFKFQGMIKWGNPDHPKFKTGNFQSIPTPKRLWSIPEYVPIPIRLEKIKVSKNAHDNRKNKSLLEQATTTAMDHETKYSWQVEQANVPCNGQAVQLTVINGLNNSTKWWPIRFNLCSGQY